ncbi:MAG: hypothetical protein ACRDTE_27230 [Pseudonocardiaceae bacterium]
MTAEVVGLAWRAVAAAAPTWTLWLGITSFITISGIILILREQCRRRTYVALLESIKPGTLLLDRTHRRKEIEIILLSELPLIVDDQRSQL